MYKREIFEALFLSELLENIQAWVEDVVNTSDKWMVDQVVIVKDNQSGFYLADVWYHKN